MPGAPIGPRSGTWVSTDGERVRVLLAGAGGAIGIPLARQLIAHGHEVLGLIRHRAGEERLIDLGVRPVVADVLDREELLRAVDRLTADAVINELTALPQPLARPTMGRLRGKGTANLLAAADVLGAGRFITQSSIFGYGCRDHGPEALTERAPFGRPLGGRSDPYSVALCGAEEQALGASIGVALRCGVLYGGSPHQLQRSVARGGLLSWVHHEDAAAATVAALERGQAGQAYNIVDDEPVSWHDVMIAMAQCLGAARPRRLPPWLFRLTAPELAGLAIDTSMRVSNTKARTGLGWHPRFPTYRHGLRAMRTARRHAADRAVAAGGLLP